MEHLKKLVAAHKLYSKIQKTFESASDMELCGIQSCIQLHGTVAYQFLLDNGGIEKHDGFGDMEVLLFVDGVEICCLRDL